MIGSIPGYIHINKVCNRAVIGPGIQTMIYYRGVHWEGLKNKESE